MLQIACSKHQVTESGSMSMAKLSFLVQGVDESVKDANPQASIATSMPHSLESANQDLRFEGFDVSLSTDHEIPAPGRRGKIKSGKAVQIDGILKTQQVDQGVKYRVLLYRISDNKLVGSILLEAGITKEIDVERGVGYHWYALSYNTLEPPVDINTTNPGTLEIMLPGGKDILFDSGTFTVPTTGDLISVPIPIVFKHQVSRIGIELNSMGMFADMTNAELSVSGISLNAGTFNLATGKWTSLSPYSPTLSWSDFMPVDPRFQDRKIAYVYTASEAAIQGIRVTLSDLSLKMDDGSIRSFSNLLRTNPSIFTFNLTPQLANDHRLLANLIESPLTIGSTRWARANLYYMEGHNPYRFQHKNVHNNDVNSFFSFKGVLPETFGENGDPCALVYPAGKWQQPSLSDFETLVGFAPPITGRTVAYVETGGLGAFSYAASGTAAPYPGNNLIFNFNGGSTSVAILGGVIDVNFGNFGNIAQYWTRSSAVNIPGIIGLGSYSYQGQRVIMSNNDIIFPELLNVSIIGVNLIESPFKNVRCVRTN